MPPMILTYLLSGVIGLAAVFGVIKARDYVMMQRGAQGERTKIVQASETQGKANAQKSKKAHDSARAPGAAERLRRDPATCVDCGR